MQAAGQGPGGAAGGDEGQGRPGDSGGPDGPAGHEGPAGGGAGEAGGGACGAPRVAPALHAPSPGRNAVEPGQQAGPAARGPSRQQLQYSLSVPFSSPVEAEMARLYMVLHGQPQRETVRKEFTVSGNMLEIQLTAEDTDQLRISVNCCFEQLSLLVQTMEHFVPPFFAKPKQ